MKKALTTDTIKEIKNTYKRFISILLMAFLGVGFFAGIRATSPDMVDTIDKYLKENNVFDIEVVSTLGLTNKDIEALNKVENVDKVYGSYSKDGIIKVDESELVTKILCVDDINKPILQSGRLPENEKECVIENNFLEYNNKQIGDSIEVDVENISNDDGEKVAYLKQKELKIVGSVNSPTYISKEKGTSKLGSGKINYYMYISKDNINLKDVYTEIYITVKNSNKYKTSTSQYENYIKDIKDDVENIKEERQNIRHQELIDKANKKVNDAEIELNNKKSEAEEKFLEAEQKIEDGKQEIQDGNREINKNKQKADDEFLKAEKQLSKGKKELQQGENELNNKESEASQGISNAENEKFKYQENLNNVNSGLQTVINKYNQIIEKLKDPNLSQAQRVILEQTKARIRKTKTRFRKYKKSIRIRNYTN